MFKLEVNESELKSIRFPKELIKEIDIITKKNKVTFTYFVIKACKYALDNLENHQTKS